MQRKTDAEGLGRCWPRLSFGRDGVWPQNSERGAWHRWRRYRGGRLFNRRDWCSPFENVRPRCRRFLEPLLLIVEVFLLDRIRFVHLLRRWFRAQRFPCLSRNRLCHCFSGLNSQLQYWVHSILPLLRLKFKLRRQGALWRYRGEWLASGEAAGFHQAAGFFLLPGPQMKSRSCLHDAIRPETQLAYKRGISSKTQQQFILKGRGAGLPPAGPRSLRLSELMHI